MFTLAVCKAVMLFAKVCQCPCIRKLSFYLLGYCEYCNTNVMVTLKPKKQFAAWTIINYIYYVRFKWAPRHLNSYVDTMHSAPSV